MRPHSSMHLIAVSALIGASDHNRRKPDRRSDRAPYRRREQAHRYVRAAQPLLALLMSHFASMPLTLRQLCSAGAAAPCRLSQRGAWTEKYLAAPPVHVPACRPCVAAPAGCALGTTLGTTNCSKIEFCVVQGLPVRRICPASHSRARPNPSADFHQYAACSAWLLLYNHLNVMCCSVMTSIWCSVQCSAQA
jgi:hypothetical protein